MRRGDAFGATGGATPSTAPVRDAFLYCAARPGKPRRTRRSGADLGRRNRRGGKAPSRHGETGLIWKEETDGGGRKKKKPPVRKSPVAPGGAGLVWKEGFCAEMEKSRKRCAACDALERVMGIEPTLPAWKAGALPLSYTRIENEEVLTPSLPPLER